MSGVAVHIVQLINVIIKSFDSSMSLSGTKTRYSQLSSFRRTRPVRGCHALNSVWLCELWSLTFYNPDTESFLNFLAEPE